MGGGAHGSMSGSSRILTSEARPSVEVTRYPLFIQPHPASLPCAVHEQVRERAWTSLIWYTPRT